MLNLPFKLVVHVPTQELSQAFQEFLFSEGYHWGSGIHIHPTVNLNPVDRYKSETCLRLDNYDQLMNFGTRAWYQDEGYRVFTPRDFFQLIGRTIPLWALTVEDTPHTAVQSRYRNGLILRKR